MIHAFKQAFIGWIGNDFQRDVHLEDVSRVHPQLGLLMGYFKALLCINQPCFRCCGRGFLEIQW